MKKILLFISFILSITANAQNGQYVGGDISMLPEYETHNSGYLDASGNKIPDLITYLVESCKWNSFRVRLFVNPTETGSSKTGVVQDLEYVTKLGKRIKDAGAQFMLDFHYSDSWADPSKQSIPSSWLTNTSNASLQDSVYNYTKRCLQHLVNNGATPDFIQVGNEISYGMLWRNNDDKCYTTKAATDASWVRFASLFNAGAKAVREVTPDAKIVFHIERSGDSNAAKGILDRMKDNSADYDVVGLSYYPFYHGFLSSLTTTLNTLQSSYADKEIQIVETAYPFQYFPSDAKVQTKSTWPGTADGQYNFIKDLISTLASYSNVKGLYYWFPEEAGCGDDSDWDGAGATVISSWLNRGLWWEDQTQTGHWPVASSSGTVLDLMQTFLSPDALNITQVTEHNNNDVNIFSVQGIRLNTPPTKEIYIKGGKKYIK